MAADLVAVFINRFVRHTAPLITNKFKFIDLEQPGGLAYKESAFQGSCGFW